MSLVAIYDKMAALHFLLLPNKKWRTFHFKIVYTNEATFIGSLILTGMARESAEVKILRLLGTQEDPPGYLCDQGTAANC
jgi:hypothetical protein